MIVLPGPFHAKNRQRSKRHRFDAQSGNSTGSLSQPAQPADYARRLADLSGLIDANVAGGVHRGYSFLVDAVDANSYSYVCFPVAPGSSGGAASMSIRRDHSLEYRRPGYRCQHAAEIDESGYRNRRNNPSVRGSRVMRLPGR